MRAPGRERRHDHIDEQRLIRPTLATYAECRQPRYRVTVPARLAFGLALPRVSWAIGLVAVPPVLLSTAYGIWKENQLDKEVWQVIDERVNAPTKAGP